MSEQEIEPREEGDNRGVELVASRIDARVDVSKALKQRLKGMTFQEIAASQGVSDSAVHAALKRFKSLVEEPEAVRAYRENEAEILDSVAMGIASHMTDPDRLAKASLNNLAFSMSKVHEARRLIRGESTANVGIRTTLVLAAHGSGKASESADLDGE